MRIPAHIAQATAHRGLACEFCGRYALPRGGKLRTPHKCPHGQWCERGKRLAGIHANNPTCAQCLAHRAESDKTAP